MCWHAGYMVSSDHRGEGYVGDELHFSVIMEITHLLNYITTAMECPLLRAMLAYWSRSLLFSSSTSSTIRTFLLTYINFIIFY